MKLLVALAACLLVAGGVVIRRPKCICSGKVTALMQDASGVYCVQHTETRMTKWHCENEAEWDAYFSNLASYMKEPRCQCTGEVTAIMQDMTGTYCAYYGDGFNRQWPCENKDEWDLYRAQSGKSYRY